MTVMLLLDICLFEDFLAIQLEITAVRNCCGLVFIPNAKEKEMLYGKQLLEIVFFLGKGFPHVFTSFGTLWLRSRDYSRVQK